MPGDDVLTMPQARRIEVFTGTARRRRWSADAKAQIVAESFATSVGEVADRYGLSKTQLFTWRRDARGGTAGDGFAEVVVDDDPAAAAVVIEVRIGEAHVRIPKGADRRMAAMVIAALKGPR